MRSYHFLAEVTFKPRVLSNTLTAYDEYFRHNRKNLLLPIQVKLSTLNLNILKEKNESHSSRISEIIGSQGCGYLNAKKDPGSENLSAANVLMSPKNS